MGVEKRAVVSRTTAILSVIILCVFVIPLYLKADERGREIMQKVHDRETPQTVKTRLRMRLIDRRGRERVREIISLAKKEKGLTKSIAKFIKPDDVKGTGFLQVEESKGKTVQYLYIPALKKVRRIPKGEKSSRFMGSDFTYEDMEIREVDKDEHTFLREEEFEGYKTYVIESVPRDPASSQYSKVISWIRADNYVPVRIDFYDKKGRLKKRLLVKELKLIDGYWTATLTEMEDFQRKHKTIMELLQVKNNEPIDDSLFSIRALKQ